MKSLIEGIEKFQHKVFPKYEAIFRKLAKGQNPEVPMITCADSLRGFANRPQPG